jgi:hypothetical protein
MTGSAMNQEYQGRLRGHGLMMREFFSFGWWGRVAEILTSAYSEQASQSPNRALDFEISLVAAPLLFASCATEIDVRWRKQRDGLFWTVLFVLQLNEDIFNVSCWLNGLTHTMKESEPSLPSKLCSKTDSNSH